MTHWLRTLGSHGVEPHDAPAAVRAWQRLHWPLFAALQFCVPAFYLELIGPAVALAVARCLYVAAGLTGLAVLGRMLALTRHRSKFLRRNALDAVLSIAALLSVIGGAVPWSVLEWALRLSFMGALALRIVLALRSLFVPHRLLILLAIGAALLLLAGAGFYWLEPRVHTYADGLWLAFESSATVGYGDIAPTTPASRVFAVFTVLLGYGMLSLTFASIAALFIGEEEKQLRHDMHRDIKRLEGEVAGIRDDLRILHELLARSAHESEDPEAVKARPPHR
ncbi:potassium transporter [Caballeronia jiangsuensis]|nr:potassium transporter [Caballeronia jiangsuensis]